MHIKTLSPLQNLQHLPIKLNRWCALLQEVFYNECVYI